VLLGLPHAAFGRRRRKRRRKRKRKRRRSGDEGQD
jgi:hypothetical protein